MLKEIYFPEKVHCLPEKRNFLSRAGLPSAKQPAEVDFLKKSQPGLSAGPGGHKTSCFSLDRAC